MKQCGSGRGNASFRTDIPMKPQPILSRCVTVYRQWPYIRRWMLHAGLYPDTVEWLVINDAPDDPCPEDIRLEFVKWGVTLIQPKANLGRAGARNACASVARARWVEFVDGDDIPLPLNLDRLQAAEDDRLQVYPNELYELADGIPVRCGVPDPSEFGFPGVLRRLPSINCRPSCLIYPRAVFLELGGFDGRFDTIEDLHFVWKWDRAQCLSAEVVKHSEAKQLYLDDGKGSVIDQIHQPMHKARFFRMVAEFSGSDGKLDPSPLWDYADSFILQGTANALGELNARCGRDGYAHPAYLTPHLCRSEERSESLYWLAKDLYLGAGKPGFTARLGEAVKLCFSMRRKR
jgi:glycosyltransferase involved in cell wall biosynthesis